MEGKVAVLGLIRFYLRNGTMIPKIKARKKKMNDARHTSHSPTITPLSRQAVRRAFAMAFWFSLSSAS